MPVDYKQLRDQIISAGDVLKTQYEERAVKREELLSLFEKIGKDDHATEKLETILKANPKERCAMPGEEPMLAVFPEPKSEARPLRLLACDGSQINPSRHDEIPIGMINTAVVEYISFSNAAPNISTDTKILDLNEQYGEDDVALLRDIAEREHLARRAVKVMDDLPTFAVTDGSLELHKQLFDLPGNEGMKNRYVNSMAVLSGMEIPTVGYIDRPSAAPVIKMLELISGKKADAENAADILPLSDQVLFESYLGAGERSAVFQMNSQLNEMLPSNLRICFFYVNVGQAKRPSLARVELPAWAAAIPYVTELLHSWIMEQCRFVMGHPYPYILDRAHESAVISLEEKERIQQMLAMELLRKGITPGEVSNKQFAKNLLKA